ncbi:MAG: hypothetical protein WEE89_18390 [Gemmatimonadota bacterium]
MSGLTCAICGGSDLFSVGVCAGCAAHGRDLQLIMVQPALDRGAQSELQHSLREWIGFDGPAQAVEQTARGAQTLAIVPSTIVSAAMRSFAAAGIPTHNVPVQQWPRALPASFITMIAAAVMAGELAGWKAAALLLWTTPLMVLLLMTGAWLQVRRPLVRFTRTQPALPAAVRSALAGALSELPTGRTRGVVLDLVAVAEQTYASLSMPFRRAALGQAVVELVSEAAALGLETMRLENIAAKLSAPADAVQPAALDQLRAGIEARVKLLGDVRGLLARIAGNQADLEDGAATEVKRLIDQLRSEQRWRIEGEGASCGV